MGDYLAYIGILRTFSQKYQLEIWAWCLMPDHLHLLAVPHNAAGLAKGMGSASLVYTQHLNRKHGRSGGIWQNRYFSCVVGEQDYLSAVARYIELNPVRSGRVKRPEEWPWSSARAHLMNKPDPLLTPFPGFPGATEWRQYLSGGDTLEIELIRKATSAGRPFADAGLVAELEARAGRSLTPKKVGRPRKQIEDHS
jgi:putative transposase